MLGMSLIKSKQLVPVLNTGKKIPFCPVASWCKGMWFCLLQGLLAIFLQLFHEMHTWKWFGRGKENNTSVPNMIKPSLGNLMEILLPLVERRAKATGVSAKICFSGFF